MSEKIPVAVIGVGEHGKNHARHLKELDGAELVGVYDLIADRGRGVAAELGVRAFENLDQALSSVRGYIDDSRPSALCVGGVVEVADENVAACKLTHRMLHLGHSVRIDIPVRGHRRSSDRDVLQSRKNQIITVLGGGGRNDSEQGQHSRDQ